MSDPHPFSPTSSRTASPIGQRAVVMGASIAGLLAARILAGRLAEVLLLERDDLPEGAVARKGTPHAVHPHGLLSKGRHVMEALLPGLFAELDGLGAVLGTRADEVLMMAGGRRLAAGPQPLAGVAVSRLALEAGIRRRVLALPGVRALTGVDVNEPVFDAGLQRVTGVRITRRDSGSQEVIAADLVVDCTGRGSRTPTWLTTWGYDAPEEERVDVGIRYSSAYFPRDARTDGLPLAVICQATANLPRPAVMIAQEPDADGQPRWVVGTGGYAGDHPEPTIDGIRRRAQEVGCAEIVRVTHELEPIGEVLRYNYSHSQRRRFERLARFPGRYLVMGDAITSFNPIYGQGMTTAACEALALAAALRDGLDGAHRRFFPAAARVIDTPWQLAVGSDLAIPSVQGRRSAQVRVVNGYLRWLYAAAEVDPHVTYAFSRVVHLLAPPASIMAPRIPLRVLGHRLRRALTAGTHARAVVAHARTRGAAAPATPARSPAAPVAPASSSPSRPAPRGA